MRRAPFRCAIATLAVAASVGSLTPTAADGGPRPSYASLDPSVRQLVNVTSPRWSDTRARMRVWGRTDGGWRLVRGPVRASLGWNGWVLAQRRRQSSGTTPAGSFAIRAAFGTRPDPGARVAYRHVDGDDYWPYDPRDPATYNILQPSRASTTRWRAGYVERLADYGDEYAYSLVLGFNLPGGVHWSQRRQQYVARRPADTERGGGIFLHVKKQRHTAGCVSAPLRQVRWLVRWLDPAENPRILMGPRRFVQRRL